MNPALQRLLWDRVDADSSLGTEAGLLILAATDGAEALDRALEGETIVRPDVVPPPERPGEPAGAYLGRVTVEGFRGIGARTSLPLLPGPGLTLVVGRNGSGKSSFAEAVELLLTGDNLRWKAPRPTIWRDGWRNLHHPTPSEIVLDLAMEGTPGTTTVRRRWQDGAELEDAATEVQPHGRPKTDLSSLGWEAALVTYRPFLSYSELGSMLDGQPSRLYDALSAVLGLDDLVVVERLLVDARKAREVVYKQAALALGALLVRLGEVDDERAGTCLKALSGRRWDLDAVESAVLLGPADSAAGSELELLRRLAFLEAPSTEAARDAVERLRDAATALAATAGTDAERAHRVADLLRRALDLHAHHGDADCPVCGQKGALDAGWRRLAQAEAERLAIAAEEATSARRAADQAVRAARELMGPPPAPLAEAERVGIDVSRVVAAWRAWSAGPAADDSAALADHLESRIDGLREAVADVRQTAQAALERRESQWRPVARDLAAWLGGAREAQRGQGRVAALKAAEAWLKRTAADLRNDRLQPIAEQAQRIWEMLRQQSNVELAPPQFEGTATRRHVKLDVTVDGVEGAALGVMSQGELHALALSLFLPRATLPESPFRFLVIDDPVQSMDPSRVDGLARLLGQVGRDRQVVVFTHDDRLPEAARRLGIAARVLQVTRQPGSVVNVVEVLTPAEQHLEDALAIALDAQGRGLPDQVARRLVPGFCREAVEAACTEVVRRRRVRRGERHADVERLLTSINGLQKLVALALYDDAGRHADVYARLNRDFGSWAADTQRAINEGAHRLYAGDLRDLIRDTRNLVARLGARA